MIRCSSEQFEHERPWLPVHEYNRCFCRLPIQAGVVLGLGGGVLVSGLMRLPDVQVRTVQLRPRVLEVARSHFGLPDSDRLNVFCGDTRRYVEESQRAVMT